MRCICLFASFLFAVSLLGCNRAAPVNKGGDGDKKSEAEIKTAFASLQAAIKAKDADKVWGLLARDTQKDAERQGKAVQEAFANLPDADKPAYEKKVGLSAKELTEMTGKLYVKSSTFYSGETGEMPGAKLEKVTAAGDSGSVVYKEDDGKGERETRSVVQEDGQWRFVLPVPKAVLK